MKKSLFLTATCIALGALSACTSMNSNDGAGLVPVANVALPKYEAVVTYKDMKIQGESNIHVLFGIFSWGESGYADNVATSSAPWPFSAFDRSVPAKCSAVYNTCKGNGVDLVLGAKYDLVIDDYFFYQKINCKVSGFPGMIKGIKEIK